MTWVQDITQAVYDVLEPKKNNLIIHIENMDSNFIKQMAYSIGADVCGVASIKRFEDAPKGV